MFFHIFVLGGAATCSEGFLICFLRVPPACFGNMAAAVQPNDLGNFQKTVNKTFVTSGCPTQYIISGFHSITFAHIYIRLLLLP